MSEMQFVQCVTGDGVFVCDARSDVPVVWRTSAAGATWRCVRAEENSRALDELARGTGLAKGLPCSVDWRDGRYTGAIYRAIDAIVCGRVRSPDPDETPLSVEEVAVGIITGALYDTSH